MSKRYNFSQKKISEIFGKTNGRSFYCQSELEPDTLYRDENGLVVSSRRNWHVDHMVPLSRGGGNEIENLVPSCRSCNAIKSDLTVEELFE